MDKIIENLYISNRVEAEKLDPNEFEVLLISKHPIERSHVAVLVHDGVAWEDSEVKTVLETIAGWLSEGKNVCVACDAGISRSVGAVVAYLVIEKGMSIHEAQDFVKAKRPMSNPHQLILNSIKRHINAKNTCI